MALQVKRLSRLVKIFNSFGFIILNITKRYWRKANAIDFGLFTAGNIHQLNSTANTTWHNHDKQDEMTDEMKYVRVQEINGGALSIICEDSDLVVVFSGQEFLSSGEKIIQDVRIDKNTVLRLPMFSINQGAVWEIHQKHIGMLKAGSFLRVQLHDYRGSSTLFKFSLNGITEQFDQLAAKGCKAPNFY